MGLNWNPLRISTPPFSAEEAAGSLAAALPYTPFV